MAVFTLKKYETPPETRIIQSGDTNPNTQESQDNQKKIIEMQIQASDSVSIIVARALYKAIPNLQENPESKEDGKEPDTQVISTEDINNHPVETLNLVRGKSSVVIINNGFRTPKEEWFLTSLESLKTKVYYSVESFLKQNNFQVWVVWK